jgi:hypothetical protein
VAATCRECPANCRPPSNRTSRVGPISEPVYAGCHGLVPLPADAGESHKAVEQAIDQLGLGDAIAQLFPRASPRWYSLWIGSPLAAEQLEAVALLVAAVGLTDLAAGCSAALAANLPLHVRLYPPGRVEGTWWRLALHCPRCKGGWSGEQARKCHVCGYVGHPAPDKKRRARGLRPYARLDRVLGAGQSAEFLARYFDFQAQTRSQDRA